MEAPNKIYLHEEDFARIYTQPSSTIDDDIEYIRKDALLEWVRFAYGKLSMNPFNVQDVFEELIDKLNSM